MACSKKSKSETKMPTKSMPYVKKLTASKKSKKK